jgi:hypothetical protein
MRTALHVKFARRKENDHIYGIEPCGGKKGESPNGLTFRTSNIRLHLRGVHKIQLDDSKYDGSNPGTNKRVGWPKEQITKQKFNPYFRPDFEPVAVPNVPFSQPSQHFSMVYIIRN